MEVAMVAEAGGGFPTWSKLVPDLGRNLTLEGETLREGWAGQMLEEGSTGGEAISLKFVRSVFICISMYLFGLTL